MLGWKPGFVFLCCILFPEYKAKPSITLINCLKPPFIYIRSAYTAALERATQNKHAVCAAERGVKHCSERPRSQTIWRLIETLLPATAAIEIDNMDLDGVAKTSTAAPLCGKKWTKSTRQLNVAPLASWHQKY